jgi:hypothetical protein
MTITLTRTVTGLLFADDFNRANGAPGANYTADAGTWAIASNRLQQTAATARLRVTALAARKDAHVQVVLQRSALTIYSAVRQRWPNASDTNFYFFDVGGSTDPTDPNKTRLYRLTSNAFTRLGGGNAPAGIAVNTDYRLTYTISGNNHDGWVNGGSQTSATDSTAGNNVNGYITLSCDNAGTTIFDDLVICTTRILTVSQLPTGYKARANGITSAASDGVNPVTIDLAGTLLPSTQIEVLDASNAVVLTMGSITAYGGDTWAFINTYARTASGGITFGGSAASAVVHSYARTASGGITFGGAASALAIRHWTGTGSGGIAFGGSASRAVGRARTAAGGIIFGGIATPARGRVFVGVGGIHFGGGALWAPYSIPKITYQRGRSYTGTGWTDDRDYAPTHGSEVERIGAAGSVVARAAGAEGMTIHKPKPPHEGQVLVDRWFRTGTGGIRFGGSAPYTFYQGSGPPITSPTSYVAFGSGGMNMGGAAGASSTTANRYARTGSGGIRFGGAASVTVVARRSYARTGAGGIRFGGTSPATFVDIPVGGGSSSIFRTPTPPNNWGPTARPVPLVTGTTYNVATAAQLTSALAACTWGDEIVVAAGARFAGSWTLPNKGTYAGGWITIRGAGPLDTACPQGRRMNAAKAAACNMPILTSVGGNTPLFQPASGAHGYRFMGLEFAPGGDHSALIYLGNVYLTNYAQMAGHMVVDRCLYRGSTTFYVNRPFYCCGENIAIFDTHIADVYGSGDSQSVLIAGFQGPYYIDNNRLEGWTENVMAGGAESAFDPSDVRSVPSDLVLTHNYFTKNLAYKGAAPFGNTSKNLFELKSCRRVECAWNIMEYQWPEAQPVATNIKSVDQGGGHPLQGTQDVHFHHNWIRYVSGGVTYTSNPENPMGSINPLHRVYEHDNLYEFVNTDPRFTGSGVMIQLAGALTDITLEHNTYISGTAGGRTPLIVEPQYIGPVAVLNCILQMDGYGMHASGRASGTDSWNFCNPNPAWRTFTNNLLVKLGNPLSWYPPGNFMATDDTGVGYANLAGRDYTVTGAYATAATDGGPIGVSNFAALMAGLAAVLNG